MPTYHIYDTTVKLYAWDPHQDPTCKIEKLSHNNAVFPIDPAYGREVEALKEEGFDGKGGLDFLSNDMPFFLCHSGRDLFFKAPTTSVDRTEPNVDQGRKEHIAVGERAQVPNKQKPRKVHQPGYEEDEEDSALSSISSSMFGESSPLAVARIPRNTGASESSIPACCL